MKSYSQAGQDLFAHALLGDGPCTFLDIGSNHPTVNSNTYALEQLGWRGLLVDSSPEYTALCREQRLSPVLEGDATKIDWNNQLLEHGWIARDADGRQMKVPFRFAAILNFALEIDYLSFDVDEAGVAALKNLPLDRLKFRVITCEHDAYRFGDGPRSEMRRIWKDAGYLMVAGDVKHNGHPFEDWWVGPGIELARPTVEMSYIEGMEWQEIIARIQ